MSHRGHRAKTPARRRSAILVGTIVVVFLLVAACSDDDGGHPHGAIADGIMAPMGEAIPDATPAQLDNFAAGEAVATRRFDLSDGLGPVFNVTFCGACHERPVTGGSAGLYRSFTLAGTALDDGSFVPAESQGEAGGVVRMYSYAAGHTARPEIPDDVNVVARRNPIPFFGVGLLAELSDEEILKRADPDDADGDGISGRPNFDRGFVGRFGRKAQTVSIEGFIRGPLFNHLGITSDPLTEEEKAALPVDSSSAGFSAALQVLDAIAQASAPDSPLTDDDGVPDPELTGAELFDLVSFAMLLAAPQLEDPSEAAIRGAAIFDDLACGACHTPRLDGPRGPLPVYSDLLLHDMGPSLADGIVQGDATGSEFRTQPLWGITSVGPYLHDGRATTVTEAILAHGGEAQVSRDAAARLSPEELADLLEFLDSLGGRDQFTPGLLPPNTAVPAAGEYGGPVPGLSEADLARFEAGRQAFDEDFGFSDGVGALRFNGDSCRACHFDPVIGGAGPRGVNVMRHGSLGDDGEFLAPDGGTILHKESADLLDVIASAGATIFELRQTPALFGLGLIDAIYESDILAHADPDDADGDGISGRPARLEDGRLGRLGWKAGVPSVLEFVRDAMGAELGLTTSDHPELTFGITVDNDDVPDAEIGDAAIESIAFFITSLAAPPRNGDPDDPLVSLGASVFEQIGCSACHVPTLDSPAGPVPLYSDLLLHETLPPGSLGIEDGTATMTEFRTAPLWGLSTTAPYLHDGSADTIEQAVVAHAGEAATTVATFRALDPDELAAILAFLDSL